MSYKEFVEGMLTKSEGSYISALRDAQTEETFSRSVSSFYYACFQSVVALMLLRGHSASKHTLVRSFVNKELVMTNLLPSDLGKFYNELMNRRSDADYSPRTTFTKSQIGEIAKNADKFISVIRGVIEKEFI